MEKVGILGGTFNPVHWGHLLMAEAALLQAKLDYILWVPTFQPPYKANTEVVAFEHRLEMVRRAIADHPAFHWSDVEADRTGPSYAIHTLNNLQELYPQVRWVWIVGLDAFQSLPRWYLNQELIARCEWLVAPRAFKNDQEPPTLLPSTCKWLDMPRAEVSSSLIRRLCREGKSIRYLVPESVRAYIQLNQLYQLPSVSQDNNPFR